MKEIIINILEKYQQNICDEKAISASMYGVLADELIDKFLKPKHESEMYSTDKGDIANDLSDKGYSIRQISNIMGYKSHRSVQILLNKTK